MRHTSLVLFVASFLQAQTPLPEELLQLTRAQRQIARQISEIPNFSCLQTISRATRASARHDLKKFDTVRLEVGYVGGEELFAWPGSTEFTAAHPMEVIGAGLGGNGVFALHLQNLFVNRVAQIHFGEREVIAGRPSLRYDYRLPPLLGGYTVLFNGQRATASAHGSFWLDAANLHLLRVLTIQDDLPADFPVIRTETLTEYEEVHLGQTAVLLPQSSRLMLLERSGKESWNQTEFSHCRRFQSDSLLSFEETPVTTSDPLVTHVREVPIPRGSLVHLTLEREIDTATAKVGDAIFAKVSSPLRVNGTVLIPEGARVTGRLRRCDAEPTPEPHFIVGLEFSDVLWAGHHARFTGELQGFEGNAPVQLTLDRTTRRVKRMVANGTLSDEHRERWIPSALPGVGTFYCLGRNCRLRTGFLTDWITRNIDN